MPKVLIVDDHPTIRLAVGMLLQQERYEVLEAEDGSSGIEKARTHRPDVVILDLGLEKLDGLTVLERLRNQANPPRVLILTGQPERLYAKRCIEAGASAFVRKDEDIEHLKAALKAVLAGYSYLPADTFRSDQSDTESKRLENLSNREFEVLRLLTHGSNNNDIAEKMNLSAKTVSTYKTRIQDKLSAGSLVEMYEIAKRNGL